MSTTRVAFSRDFSEAIDYFIQLTNKKRNENEIESYDNNNLSNFIENLTQLQEQALAGYSRAQISHNEIAIAYLQNFSDNLRTLMNARKTTDDINQLLPHIHKFIESATPPAGLSENAGVVVTIKRVAGGIVGGLLGMIVCAPLGAVIGFIGGVAGSGLLFLGAGTPFILGYLAVCAVLGGIWGGFFGAALGASSFSYPSLNMENQTRKVFNSKTYRFFTNNSMSHLAVEVNERHAVTTSNTQLQRTKAVRC